MMKLGETISLCRKKRGYTQAQLASLAGISVSHLSLTENNKRDPSLSAIESISNALRIPLSVLLFLASENECLTDFNEKDLERISQSIIGLMDGASRQETLF